MIKFPNVITRYHGATDYKPSRISASAEGYDRVYISYDHSLTVTANHKAAALALATRNDWLRDGIKLSGAEMPNGNGYAFVFTATEANG